MNRVKMRVLNTRHFKMVKPLLLLFPFFILLCFLWSHSTRDRQILLSKAGHRAAGDFVDQLIQEKRCEAITGIAVFEIKNDDKEDSMRSAIKTKILDTTEWKLLVVGQKEENEIIEYIGYTLKYQKHYDSNSLIPIGERLGTQYAIVGNLTAVRWGPKTARVIFEGQVLDLKKGEVMFARSSQGTFREKLNSMDGVVNMVIAIGLFSLLFFLSRGNYFYGEIAKTAFLWGMSIASWGAIVFMYYAYPL